MSKHIAFIGGGNMATAIISGLLQRGWTSTQMDVVEPLEAARHKLEAERGVQAHAVCGPFLQQAALVVWAVKPQSFAEAALQARPHLGDVGGPLHLSVAAGIPSQSIADWLGCERVVRGMPNTPALIGKGIAGLFARPAVTADDRQRVQEVMDCTGQWLWLEQEAQLDAVTAISGSGPAYVFYFLEAMTEAGAQMGLSRSQAYQLAMATFSGAAELARTSNDSAAELRQKVTSKGGTTYAAITAMDESRVATLFIKALHAARQRATELGAEFGAAS